MGPDVGLHLCSCSGRLLGAPRLGASPGHVHCIVVLEQAVLEQRGGLVFLSA